jgi:hypothetical protein
LRQLSVIVKCFEREVEQNSEENVCETCFGGFNLDGGSDWSAWISVHHSGGDGKEQRLVECGVLEIRCCFVFWRNNEMIWNKKG